LEGSPNSNAPIYQWNPPEKVNGGIEKERKTAKCLEWNGVEQKEGTGGQVNRADLKTTNNRCDQELSAMGNAL